MVDKNIEQSVTQIISDHIIMGYSTPWANIGANYTTGSGFCIEYEKKKYIMTNAHCVHNSSYIKIRKRSVQDTFLAEIIWIVYECDLALLDIKDAKFWQDIKPLKFGKMPNKLDKIFIYGYPYGGLNISITKGIVSRVQIVRYLYAVDGIAIQVDAAINSGNSGGPAINKDGDIVGIVFSSTVGIGVESMGYIIPPTIIDFFLRSFNSHKSKNISFPGICGFDIKVQSMRNVPLRNYIGLPPDFTGILIMDVAPANVAAKYLQIGDVLMAINGYTIDNDGTMSLESVVQSNVPSGELIPYGNYIGSHILGEKITVTVWRKNKKHDITFTLGKHQYPVALLDYQIGRQYYTLVGLVFLPLSVMLIQEKRDNKEYIYNLVDTANTVSSQYPEEQLIILSDVFQSHLTDGFPHANFIIDSINDIKITNMKHFVKVAEAEINRKGKKKSFITFKFRNSSNIIVLNLDDIKKYDNSIRYQYFGQIPRYSLT